MISENLKNGLDMYLNDGIPTGGFLRAVLENNFFGAIARADINSQKQLLELATYIVSNFPVGSYGSKENVNEWLSGGWEKYKEFKSLIHKTDLKNEK